MRLAAVLLLVPVLCVAGADAAPRPPSLVVTADRVFDGRTLQTNAAVVVDGRRVVAVESRASAPRNAVRRVDLGDATILPGFVDLHVHEQGDAMLGTGVTTVRNVGGGVGPPEARPGHLRVFRAGPLLTVPGGYPIPVFGPAVALPVRGVAGARVAVSRLVSQGAALIKIALEPGVRGQWPMLSVEQVRAIVAEAHRLHRIVTAHVTEGRGVDVALAGGVDELAHMPCRETSQEQLRKLASRGIEIVATLHVEALNSCAGGVANGRVFRAAGGRLLYGTDVGNGGIPFGLDVAELRLLLAVGLSPLEVLASATSEAGKELRRAPLGSLVPRAPADLFAVRGDATRSFAKLRGVVLVVAGGVVVVRSS